MKTNLNFKQVFIVHNCILHAYSYGFITEGAAMELTDLDRIQFRECWISFLQTNPEVAIATGNEKYLELKNG